jgi:CPA2 family monovalent cation:H+ antiporter-2
MSEHNFLVDMVTLLVAMVVFVLLFQRLRLGAVLGYLFGGVAIGPAGLGLLEDGEMIRALAELGVAFLLFTVGLELPLQRIRVMPAAVFWLGAAQILVTGALIGGGVALFGGGAAAALVVGGGLALSSTAIVMRLLSEGGEMTSRLGRTAIAILLMQDLAVGPLLVLVVVLGQDGGSVALSIGLALLKVTVALVAILGLGRYVVRPLFWLAAVSRTPEVFAALTLLVVLCTGLATQLAGLSLAFGAFLAGMLLAETRYRHQVAAEIQPFRGLLLGLFFITVGMTIDPTVAVAHAGTVVPLVLLLLAGKALLLAGLARLVRLPLSLALHLGLLLSQAGEFAFVLVGAGVAVGALDIVQSQVLIVVVALTMMITPLLAKGARRAARHIAGASVVGAEEEPDTLADLNDHVFIAGFGRVGRAVASRLASRRVPFVAVDLDPHRVARAAEAGLRVLYGDATRPEVLEAVHVERARAVVIALNNPRETLRLVALLRYVFPDLRIYARAYDRDHAEELRRAGAFTVVPELEATGVTLAGSILDQIDPAAPFGDGPLPGSDRLTG